MQIHYSHLFKLIAFAKKSDCSTSHAPAIAEDGLPKERYQRYHLEKAKGGIGDDHDRRIILCRPDSPSVFGQLDVSSDRIIPYFTEFAERIHKEDAASFARFLIWAAGPLGMMEIGFPSLSHRVSVSQLIEDFQRSWTMPILSVLSKIMLLQQTPAIVDLTALKFYKMAICPGSFSST